MKVLGISGSMRKEGNTAQLIQVILGQCRDAGIQTEFISLARQEDPSLSWLWEMHREEMVH